MQGLGFVNVVGARRYAVVIVIVTIRFGISVMHFSGPVYMLH
jgi:hypothetical protein